MTFMPFPKTHTDEQIKAELAHYPGCDNKLGTIAKQLLAERDELRRWRMNLYQDQCENAYVEVSLLDAARHVIHQLKPDHPFLKEPMPSFGVWEAQRHEIEALRKELNSADEYASAQDDHS